MSRTYSITAKGKELTLISVTTLIDLFNSLGFFGDVKKFYNVEEAQWIGDQSHYYIARLSLRRGIVSLKWAPIDERIKNVLLAFMRWCKKVHFKAKHVEVEVHNLRYSYAGRLDAVGYANGTIGLYDWKSGFMDLQRVKMQLVMYLYAYLGTYPRRVIRQLRGVHFNKLTGEFDQIIITMEDAKQIWLTFQDYYSRIDSKMLQTLSGTSNMKFRNKKLNDGGITMASPANQLQVVKTNQQIEELHREKIVRDLSIFYKGAPGGEIMKAAMLITFHGYSPENVFIIPHKNGKRAAEIGCTCQKWPCPHADAYDWVTVIGIKGKRESVSADGRALQYVFTTQYGDDIYPRVMSDAEVTRQFGKIDQSKVYAICKLKDSRGNLVIGYGTYGRGASVIGGDKGNSAENMAMIRAESKALEKLPNVKKAPSNVEVIDQEFMEGEYSIAEVENTLENQGVVDDVTVCTGEVVEVATASNGGEIQPIDAEVVRDKDPNQYAELLITCPDHKIKWGPDRFKNLSHGIDGAGFCQLKRDIVTPRLNVVRKAKGMSAADIEQLLKDRYNSSWSKLNDTLAVEMLQTVEIMTAAEHPLVLFQSEVDTFASQLGIEQEQLLSKYPDCKKLADLSYRQRKDLLNNLADMVAAKG